MGLFAAVVSIEIMKDRVVCLLECVRVIARRVRASVSCLVCLQVYR